MAKENTHIYVAEEALRRIKDKEIKKLLSENRDYYYLGSIAPDAFYYHKKEEVKKISEVLHGHGTDGAEMIGRPTSRHSFKTNTLVFDMLDEIKKRRGLEEGVLSRFSAQNLAFIMGYISHCACDIATHPFIGQIAGDYYVPDLTDRIKSRYAHMYLETYFDSKFTPFMFGRKRIKAWLVDKVVFADTVNKNFKISIKEIKKSFKRQFVYNILFKSKIAYLISLCLNKCGLLAKNNLGFFYANVSTQKMTVPGDFKGRSFSEIETEFEKLLQKSILSSKEMIEMAFFYYNGNINRAECERVISGKSMA